MRGTWTMSLRVFQVGAKQLMHQASLPGCPYIQETKVGNEKRNGKEKGLEEASMGYDNTILERNCYM